MHFLTTDGREWDVAENCLYCRLNTVGQHHVTCPLAPAAPLFRPQETKIEVRIVPGFVESRP